MEEETKCECRQVKYIDILFENCETLRIPRNRIGNLYIGDIKTYIRRVACNSISKCTRADSIMIEIFNMENKSNNIKRILSKNDITAVYVIYEDDREECYYTDYEEPEGQEDCVGAENVNQKVYVSKPGNIYITIGNDVKIEDYISEENIEDTESQQFKKDMLDIEENELEGQIFSEL